MIKFKAGRGSGNREMLGLGLSEANLGKLREGKPIHIMAEDVGIDVDLLIFWGQTEESMTADLKKLGLITEETKIKQGFVEN